MNLRTLFVIASALLFVSCSELKKDLPAPIASGIAVHEDGWMTPAAANFHGRVLKVSNWDDATCQKCHGGNFAGGASMVSCYTCHPPYPHFSDFDAGHPAWLSIRGYPLAQCKLCHGASYAGGTIVTLSCQQSGCHADATGNPKSPETCNTCHGNFRASASLTGSALLLSAAPPKSVAGDTAATNPRVGAHQKHLATGTLGRTVKCQECHTVPGTVFNGNHPLANRATVAFNDTLAALTTGKGAISPSFNPANFTCSNTYCHGNWVLRKGATNTFAYTDSLMLGASAQAVWLGGSAQAACNSCHGTAGASPTYVPTGHIAATLATCGGCHTGIVDGSGKIIDQTKHINGKVNVFGTERAF